MKRIIIWLPTALILLLLVTGPIIRAGLWSLSRLSGLPIKVGEIHLDPVHASLWAREVVVYSPRGFRREPMFTFDLVFINLKVWPLFLGRLHFEDLILHLAELRMVRTTEGELNLGQSELPSVPVKIENFELEIDRFVYKDFSAPVAVLEKSFDVNIHAEESMIQDLDDLSGFIRTVVEKAVRDAAISDLFNLNPADFLEDNVFVLIMAARLSEGMAPKDSGTTDQEDPLKKIEAAVSSRPESIEDVKQEISVQKKIIHEEKETLQKELQSIEQVKVEVAMQEVKLEADKEALEEEEQKVRELKKTAVQSAESSQKAVSALLDAVETQAEVKKVGLEEARQSLKEAKGEIEEAEQAVHKKQEILAMQEESIAEIEAHIEEKTKQQSNNRTGSGGKGKE